MARTVVRWRKSGFMIVWESLINFDNKVPVTIRLFYFERIRGWIPLEEPLRGFLYWFGC